MTRRFSTKAKTDILNGCLLDYFLFYVHIRLNFIRLNWNQFSSEEDSLVPMKFRMIQPREHLGDYREREFLV